VKQTIYGYFAENIPDVISAEESQRRPGLEPFLAAVWMALRN
jgi:hypothetical protein